jgi:hypothetical protein
VRIAAIFENFMSELTTFYIQTIAGFFLGQAIITEAGKLFSIPITLS